MKYPKVADLVPTGAELRSNPPARVPTIEDIARAWRYIEREYTLKEGSIDGEQWAEGLAFGRSNDDVKKNDPTFYADLMDAAREFKPQLTDQQWSSIAARADYLRAEQGEPAMYRQNPDDREAAIDRYKTFHRYDPKDIGEFPASFAIPAKMKRVGKAIWTTYRSGKVDPGTLELPKKPVNYIHDHDAGVEVYVPVGDDDFDGETVSVPKSFTSVTALAKLGESLGFCVEVDGDQIEAESTKPLPELYCSADGKCLYVVQDKREVLAMIWGGALGVFARGIDG